MASFLITTPSSNSVGSNTADLFDLNVTNGVSVFGTEGADTITATDALVGTDARFNGGKGSDTVTFNGGTLGSSEVLMGMGIDIVDTNGDLTATVVRGGAGKDDIRLDDSVLLSSTVNGNDMADVISADIDILSQSSLIAGGLGKDVLSAIFEGAADGMSVNGGAGHDSISLVLGGAANSSLVVAGGAGIDTITLDNGANLTGAFNINGNDQGDRFTFGGDFATLATATIGGGLGADTLQFTAGLTTFTNGEINGGAGSDSIFISAEFAGGSINGGAGVDTIEFTDYITGVGGGISFGEAGADIFNLGAGMTVVDKAVQTGGRTLGFSNFDQSTLGTMDVVSAGVTFGGAGTTGNITLFKVQSDVVDMSIANGVAVTQFTGTNGLATFTSTFAATISDRVSSLDATLTEGQAIAFTDNTDYFVFVQGGAAAGSGTGDDLLVKLDNTAISDLTLVNVSSFQVRVSAS